jgi:tripartite-type tricarboxylate transporter receptor subunit TctC
MKQINTKRRAILTSLTSVGLVAALSICQVATAADFAGKTINFINFGGPGSPPDVWYRSLIPFLEKHIEGNPSIKVINKPGAGSMIAANYTANALDADGLNIGSMNGVAMNRAANGDKSAKFNLREMHIIGGQKLTRLVAVKKEGIKNIDDLLNMDGQLVIGMESNATPYYDAFFELTGIDAKIISSYQRFPDTLQAFRTGEIDAMPMSVIEWLNFGPDMAKDGAVAMWQYGFSENGVISGSDAVDIPTGHAAALMANPDAEGTDAWNTLTLQALTSVISNQIWAPAGTPEDYVNALSAAFEAATSDEEFLALHEKQYGLRGEWTGAAKAKAIVEDILGVYGN